MPDNNNNNNKKGYHIFLTNESNFGDIKNSSSYTDKASYYAQNESCKSYYLM